jgi:hypothetical protein
MTKRLTPVTHWRMPASRHAHVHVHVKELRRLSGHAAMADWQEKSNGRSEGVCRSKKLEKFKIVAFYLYLAISVQLWTN